MVPLCRIATAALLMLHLTVGCCGHHAHACDSQGQSSSAQESATSSGQCQDGRAGHADHAHHGPQDCQGARCSVVSFGRTVIDSLTSPSQTPFALLLADPLSLVRGESEQHFPTGRLLLPVRLHLANQVLLI
jgi:hypothetical protein